MVAEFYSGLLTAWAAAQVALGVFFCLAYALARRETEYLLFGLIALALAGATLGTGLGYLTRDPDAWRVTDLLGSVGLIVAVSVHLHFLMRYARLRLARSWAGAIYVVAAGFLALRLSGVWLVAGSDRVVAAQLAGMELRYFAIDPGPVALLFYSFAGASLLVGPVILLRVYRSGRREALFALVGSVALLAAVPTDLALVAGLIEDFVFVWPHAFMVYAAAVATTLLYRYRSTTGDLEQTALSLRERMAELHRSYEELRSMEEELVRQRQLAAVGQLAASIAHEVRNPLAVIVNAAAGMRRPRLGDVDQQALLAMIDEEAARLNGLVTDLVRFARPVEPTWASVDLRELLDRATGVLEDRYQVETSVPHDSRLSTVTVDPSLLGHALDALLQNACQAMPKGGRIKIRAVAGKLDEAPCVRVEIQDEGEGMSAQARGRALEPFFTTRTAATGLGLPITARIMEAHGGGLDIATEPEVGTTVALLIPHPEPPGEPGDRPSRRVRRLKSGVA